MKNLTQEQINKLYEIIKEWWVINLWDWTDLDKTNRLTIEDLKSLIDDHWIKQVRKWWDKISWSKLKSLLSDNISNTKSNIKNPDITQQIDNTWISMDSEVKESPKIKLRDKPLQSTVDEVVESVDRKAPKISMKDIKMSWSVDDVVDVTKKWASSIDDILNAIPKEELAAANNAIKAWASTEVKESISWISKVLNKIPWWTKILAWAKVAGKLAWPVWVLVSLYEWLKDVRTDLIQDEEKTWLQNFIQNLWKTVPDLAAKTVINSVNWVTDLWSFLIWNSMWWMIDAADMWQAYLFWDKKDLEEAKKRNFRKDITEALNKSWDKMATTAKAWFDKFNYWLDKDVDFDKSYEKYMKDQWRDSSWILLEVEDEKPVTTQVENKQQQNIVTPTSDTNQWTQQWRRLFKLKDGTFWYLSQWWENEWKLVRWFKTLDEAKNAVNQWVKWFHLWNIKNELSKVNTTDKTAVENVLTKYIKEKWINPSNAKDKWITNEWLKEIWISF